MGMGMGMGNGEWGMGMGNGNGEWEWEWEWIFTCLRCGARRRKWTQGGRLAPAQRCHFACKGNDEQTTAMSADGLRLLRG